jgi:hypothetical protein
VNTALFVLACVVVFFVPMFVFCWYRERVESAIEKLESDCDSEEVSDYLTRLLGLLPKVTIFAHYLLGLWAMLLLSIAAYVLRPKPLEIVRKIFGS